VIHQPRQVQVNLEEHNSGIGRFFLLPEFCIPSCRRLASRSTVRIRSLSSRGAAASAAAPVVGPLRGGTKVCCLPAGNLLGIGKVFMPAHFTSLIMKERDVAGGTLQSTNHRAYFAPYRYWNPPCLAK